MEKTSDGKVKKKIGHVGKQGQLTVKKNTRKAGYVRSLLRDQIIYPDLHPRQYVVNAFNPVYPAPAPTCYSNFTGPDRRQLHRFLPRLMRLTKKETCHAL